MSLRSVVKVSHLSNLSDARYCSGMGVDVLGFRVLPEDEYYVSPAVFQDIRGWIAGPRIAAEIYGIASAEQIGEVIRTYAPDYFELTWNEYERFRNELTLPCIVQVASAEQAKTARAEDNIVYLLVDEDVTCDDMGDVAFPVLLNIRSLDKLTEKQDEPCFQGYVLEGPRQTRPGITNYDELGTILEALEEEG